VERKRTLGHASQLRREEAGPTKAKKKFKVYLLSVVELQEQWVNLRSPNPQDQGDKTQRKTREKTDLSLKTTWVGRKNWTLEGDGEIWKEV